MQILAKVWMDHDLWNLFSMSLYWVKLLLENAFVGILWFLVLSRLCQFLASEFRGSGELYELGTDYSVQFCDMIQVIFFRFLSFFEVDGSGVTTINKAYIQLCYVELICEKTGLANVFHAF